MRNSHVVFAAIGAAVLAASVGVVAASAQAVVGTGTGTAGAVGSEDSAAAASTFPENGNRAYQIRPGDVVSISVYNEPGFSQAAVRVLPGGVIQEPLAGQIHIGGMTPDQAGHAVGHALMHFVRHPDVSVSVASVAPVDVYILGNVKVPGKYQMQPDSRLMDALSAAGGLGPTDGDLPDAHLQTGDKVTLVSLQHLLHDGDLALNTQIHGQTTIYIPAPAVFNVQVYGAVDHSGDVPMHEGDRLIAAVARAGPSQSSNADLNHVKLVHKQADGTTTTTVVNMYKISNSNDQAEDPIVAKGDIISVPAGKKGGYDPTNPLTTLLYMFRI